MTINSVRVLLPMATSPNVKSRLITILIAMASDVVPNIRMNAAKCVKEVSKFITDSNNKDQVKTAVRMLNKDEDIDVRYYAEITLRVI